MKMLGKPEIELYDNLGDMPSMIVLRLLYLLSSCFTMWTGIKAKKVSF